MDEELDERRRRAALNQALFRQMNERTMDLHGSSAFIEFACECAQKTCELPVPLSVDEYEEVRTVPTHFVVSRGHVAAGVEVVVRETQRFQVVEKVGVAAEIAGRLDPRSPHGSS
jgi:hypothetical protein